MDKYSRPEYTLGSEGELNKILTYVANELARLNMLKALAMTKGTYGSQQFADKLREIIIPDD